MTQWSRTISRMVTGAAAPTPAWRTAMTATDTLYEVGVTPPTVSLTWPGGIANPPGYQVSSEEANGDFGGMLDNYGGGIYAEDVGSYGSMLYFSTGEDVFLEMIAKFDLSADLPLYSWYQQPGFVTTQAAASAGGSDLYYNPTDYAALPTARKIDAHVDEVTWLAAWRAAGATFPVGWKNWVFWRKPDTFVMGGTGSPWNLRYHNNQFIPATWTGTGDSALILHQHNHHGPFRAWAPAFNTITDTEWSANVWPGTNRRKFAFHAMNLRTKAWQRLAQWVPDMGFSPLLQVPFSARDDAAKRIYYISGYSPQLVFHADFTGGLAGMTVSSAVAFSNLTQSIYNESSGAFVWNDPAGRKLWYLQSISVNNTLLLYDMTAQAITALNLAPRGLSVPLRPASWPTYYPWLPMSGGYDPVANKVHFVSNQRGGPMYCHSFTVPTGDATNAANYTVTSRQLSLAAGASYEAQTNDHPMWGWNDRSKFLPRLGICLVPQHHGKTLAFRPA